MSGFFKALFPLLIATSGVLFSATSIELKRDYERWVHRTWTTENGLPQNTVYSLAQTNDGVYAIHADKNDNIWLGTDAGLKLLRQGKFFQFQEGPPAL